MFLVRCRTSSLLPPYCRKRHDVPRSNSGSGASGQVGAARPFCKNGMQRRPRSASFTGSFTHISPSRLNLSARKLGEPHHPWWSVIKIQVDLVIGRLDRQARHEGNVLNACTSLENAICPIEARKKRNKNSLRVSGRGRIPSIRSGPSALRTVRFTNLGMANMRLQERHPQRDDDESSSSTHVPASDKNHGCFPGLCGGLPPSRPLRTNSRRLQCLWLFSHRCSRFQTQAEPASTQSDQVLAHGLSK